MIPLLVDAGFRCVAPDLIGFGRSDKPIEKRVYTYATHLNWLKQFVHQIDLSDVTLFAQDWGGLLGLRLLCEQPQRFNRVALGNTALPIGESLGQGFDQWLAFSQSDQFDDVGALFARSVLARELSPQELDAYRAPFPESTYLAGVKAFPTLVPITPAHEQVTENKAAWQILSGFEKPLLTLWGLADVVFGEDKHLQKFIDLIPGASGQPHQKFVAGGHFVQDDYGEELAQALIGWS